MFPMRGPEESSDFGITLGGLVDLPYRIEDRDTCREKYQRQELGSNPGIEENHEIIHNVNTERKRDKPSVDPLFLHRDGNPEKAYNGFNKDGDRLDEGSEIHEEHGSLGKKIVYPPSNGRLRSSDYNG
jgi:hypothetical protein